SDVCSSDLPGSGVPCASNAPTAVTGSPKTNSRCWWNSSRRKSNGRREALAALDEWAQLEDAVRISGRSEKTIYRWARHGKVRTVRPGDVLWFNIADLRLAKRHMPGRPRKET